MSTALVLPALLMGLFGGAHCAVMCGGVSSVLCAKPKGNYSVPFNLGRVGGYTLLGAVVASTSALPLPPQIFDTIRFAFRSLAALCMLSVGLHMLGLPSFVRLLESVGGPLWKRVAPLAKRFIPLRSGTQALGAGALWALMPCGLLYGALALAVSASSIREGALTMLAFGIGTTPVMAGIGLAASRFLQGTQSRARSWIRRGAGVFVLAFGLWSTIGVAQEATAPRKHACCAHAATAPAAAGAEAAH